MKFIKKILLVGILFSLPLFVLADEIVISDADTVWNSDLIVASPDVIDSTDALPQTLSEAFVSNADTVWNANLEKKEFETPPEKWSFAVITDLHIGRGYSDYDGTSYESEGEGEDYYLTERLKNVVQWIIDNGNNIDCEETKCPIKFLAVLGDIGDSAELSEFCKTKEILDKLEVPYVPLFGNHDVWAYTEGSPGEVKGPEFFEKVFWTENPICENATSSKNFTRLKEELNFERDETNKDYKNFLITYGGINFIGLDFIKREKTAKAEIHSPTETWLKETLNKFQVKEPVILFSHHPFTNPFSRIPYTSPVWNFNSEEIEKINNILESYENIVEGQQILGSFAGHIHGYYPQEIWGVNIPEVNLFFEANWQYPSLSTVPVLTTEAVMVGSNREDAYLKEKDEKGKLKHNKGLIKIVKVLSNNEIDFEQIEGRYDPDTGKGKEFIALNPYISRGYTIIPEKVYPCLFFKAHAFTNRDPSFYWDFGDESTSSNAWIPLHCYEEAKTYNVKLTLKDKETEKEEFITRKIEVPKEPLIPKTIKLAKETYEKVKIISKEFGEDLKEIIKKVGNIALDFTDELLFKLKITHSEEIEVPVGIITSHFEKAKEDIDLTNLKIDFDPKAKKSLFYMSEWPAEIEKEKILFIPK